MTFSIYYKIDRSPRGRRSIRSFAAQVMKACLLVSALFYGILIPNCVWSAPVRIAVRIDQEMQGSLGLPTVPATHHTLYDSVKEPFRFCHHPNAVVYQDRLYVMWSNGVHSEDRNQQRVFWSNTTDGVIWSKPEELIADPDGEAGSLCAVAAGFHVHGNELVAYYSAMKRSNPTHVSTVYAVTSKGDNQWSAPIKIVEGFFIESPRRLPSGRILMGGQFPDASARIIYTDSSDGLSGWKDSSIPPFPDFVYRSGFPEPNWFLREDGTIVMLFRSAGPMWLYASTSNDQGVSWSRPERTNLPSATSRMATGNLPDGRAFCIWNPSQRFGRNPLVIAISDDGITFNSAFVLRGESTYQRHVGESKGHGWQYPSAVVWRDCLWVAYSVNKEDVVVSRIKLSDLK